MHHCIKLYVILGLFLVLIKAIKIKDVEDLSDTSSNLLDIGESTVEEAFDKDE